MFWYITEEGARLDQVSTMANPRTAWRRFRIIPRECLKIIPREDAELLSESTVTHLSE